MDPDEFIDQYCWNMAYLGQSSFRPGYKAMEKTQVLIVEDMPQMFTEGELERYLYERYGEHTERWLQATDAFGELKSYGFEPVERAARYARENDLSPIDWTWLDESYQDGVERFITDVDEL